MNYNKENRLSNYVLFQHHVGMHYEVFKNHVVSLFELPINLTPQVESSHQFVDHRGHF